MCELSNVLLVSLYVASMGALLFAMYILYKDSKALQEVYKEFREKKEGKGWK